MKSEKTALRKRYLEIRENKTNRFDADVKIASAVFNSEFYKKCDTLLCFVGTGSEISTMAILEKALADGKRVAVPKCKDKVGNMSFHYIEDISQLRGGMYGIPEPPESNESFTSVPFSLCLLPGLCYDKHGNRLGYGKGYYDRFLADFNGVAAGLCYEECLCESLPQEATDKKVNYIITDERIYKI